MLCASELLPEDIVLVVESRLDQCLLGICTSIWPDKGFQCTSTEICGNSIGYAVRFDLSSNFISYQQVT